MSIIKIKNSENQFDCDEQDTILRAAIRSGIKIPYECNSGGCGSCKFDLIEGKVLSTWDAPPGLSPRDIRKGKRLACQYKPVTDCEIAFGEDHSDTPDYIPQRRSVTYVGQRKLTADMSEFHFKDNFPARFMPGQFAMLTLPGVAGDRAYSMSNNSNEMGDWTFIIKKMPGGSGSDFLFNKLKQGDSIKLDGPYGLSYLRPEIERDVVCIGGGSGLSPMMSIARAMTTNGQYKNKKIIMFYGGRAPADICTPQLVSEMDANGEQLSCHNVTSDVELSAEQGWDGECCFVHEYVEKILGSSIPDFDFYFCGPPPMTAAVQRLLMIDYKVPFEQIHFDRFF